MLDTSVVIDLELLDPASLPLASAIAAITLAELAAGPHAVSDVQERARRQRVLQVAESNLECLPFDEQAARAYARLFVVVATTGRKARGRRAVDLLIAATSVARGLPLFTRNPDDFAGLESLLEVVTV